jgi:N-acetylglucosaminyldiphosphoundecaprenol N-acetyl-beta-D-mannosaminyltransferase
MEASSRQSDVVVMNKERLAVEITILGVRIHPIDMRNLNILIRDAIRRNKRIIIAGQNLHGVYLYHRDEKRKAYCDMADIVRVDGMSLIFWARILGYSVRRENRVALIDWIHPLISMAEIEGWKVFYLGGKPGVADQAAEKLRQQYPNLLITTRCGYFTLEENDVVLNEIADFQPHILMVGMGMPRQEQWILDNLDRIRANAIISAGACFDYVAGKIPTPPRWMGQMGLEWLYRLISEPKRLSYRYLVEPWYLVPLMIKDIWQRFSEMNYIKVR